MFIILLILFTFVKSQIFINDYNRNIETLSIEINGTHDGSITLPLWFEIYNNNNLQDYGAFSANNPWRFLAKHLNWGDNYINVYAMNNQGQKISLTIIYRINDNLKVSPRPRPAEIIWGKLYSDSLLSLTNIKSWEYVQKYQDGYFIHSTGFDLSGNPEIVLKNLYNILGSDLTRWICELGGTTQPDNTWPDMQISQWGDWIDRISTTGIVFSTLCHDWQQNIEAFVNTYPEYNADQIINLETSLWKSVFEKYLLKYPWSKISQTSSPVWWNYGKYPSLTNKDNMNYGPIQINMQSLMNKMSNSAKETGYPIYLFGSDVPEYSLNWNIQSDKITYQEKILAYENYLISQGDKHMLLCMGPNDNKENSWAWDNEYSSQSLQELYLYQKIGGRADIYNFESFYTQGPYNIVPEDMNNTYTNTVKTALKYLKGIKDVSGTLETLSFTKNLNSITLTNTGQSLCMPSIIAINNNGILWYSYNIDITHIITSPEGFVITEMLQPGESFILQFKSFFTYNVQLQAFWNPQDPTGVIRDSIFINNTFWNYGPAQTPSYPIY